MNPYCPICNSNFVTEFYRAINQPVNENVLFDNENDAKRSSIGDIEMFFCNNCGFAFNNSFQLGKVDYSSDYKYTQPPSNIFNTYIENLIYKIIKDYNIRNSSLIEIGCGKGDFLRKLCKLGNNRGLGFDTSYEGPLEIIEENLQFKKDFFSMEKVGFNPDFIFSRQVLEHIPHPMSIISEIYNVFNDNSGKVFIETPNLEWILSNNILWDFYYEHCSYYTSNSLSYLLKKNGFNNITTENLFNNQYVGIFASKNNQTKNNDNMLFENDEQHYELINKIKKFSENARLIKSTISKSNQTEHYI